MTDFSAKKNRNGAKSIPTWSGRQDSNLLETFIYRYLRDF